MPSSLFGPLFARKGQRTGAPGTSGSNTTTGRYGPSGPGSTNAQSSVFQFTDTKSGSNVTTYKLSADGDWITMYWSLSVTATGNSTSADILGAISQVQILGANGPVITMSPMPDFNYFQQRFSPLHTLPTQQVATAASATKGSYTLYGVNLPQSGGPYTLIVTIQAPASFNVSCTALSVTYTVSLGQGDCAGLQTNYAYSGLGFTPAASGINDLAVIAPIQNVELVEVFMSGFTAMASPPGSTVNDISYVQLMSQGGTLGPRIQAEDLVSRANAEMANALYSAAESVSSSSTGTTPTLFLLFPLKTTLILGNRAHMYLNWGTATPSSTIRTGYVWLVKTG